MKNKKYLILTVLAISFLRPVPAHAFFFELLEFLFGSGAVSRQASPSCLENGETYTCPPRSPRLQSPAIESARRAMREAGMKPVASNADERRNCTRYANGCQDCHGSQHPMSFQSPKGNTIKIQKAGQNYLTDSIRRVLMRMADRKGRNIIVTSGYRSCAYQASRGVGVRRSQHLLGNAADFLFEGSGPTRGTLAQFARSTLDEMGNSNVGGTGTYCSAPAHVDTGNKRSWNWCR